MAGESFLLRNGVLDQNEIQIDGEDSEQPWQLWNRTKSMTRMGELNGGRVDCLGRVGGRARGVEKRCYGYIQQGGSSNWPDYCCQVQGEFLAVSVH